MSYVQVDGVAMGSQVLVFRLSVDDTFCLLHTENEAPLIFDYQLRWPNTVFARAFADAISSTCTRI